jgi:hypothetical protein
MMAAVFRGAIEIASGIENEAGLGRIAVVSLLRNAKCDFRRHETDLTKGGGTEL